MAKLSLVDRKASKIGGFIIVYNLYMKIRIIETIVEEQIQWILIYVQRETMDIWKENMLEDLETRVLKFEILREFLEEVKKEFGEDDEKSIKVMELK